MPDTVLSALYGLTHLILATILYELNTIIVFLILEMKKWIIICLYLSKSKTRLGTRKFGSRVHDVDQCCFRLVKYLRQFLLHGKHMLKSRILKLICLRT